MQNNEVDQKAQKDAKHRGFGYGSRVGGDSILPISGKDRDVGTVDQAVVIQIAKRPTVEDIQGGSVHLPIAGKDSHVGAIDFSIAIDVAINHLARDGRRVGGHREVPRGVVPLGSEQVVSIEVEEVAPEAGLVVVVKTFPRPGSRVNIVGSFGNRPHRGGHFERGVERVAAVGRIESDVELLALVQEHVRVKLDLMKTGIGGRSGCRVEHLLLVGPQSDNHFQRVRDVVRKSIDSRRSKELFLLGDKTVGDGVDAFRAGRIISPAVQGVVVINFVVGLMDLVERNPAHQLVLGGVFIAVRNPKVAAIAPPGIPTIFDEPRARLGSLGYSVIVPANDRNRVIDILGRIGRLIEIEIGVA